MNKTELKQLAELAMKKHKAVVSNWREGRIKKVWQDEDGNLCVEYNSGHWWHYRNLDKPVPEWWQEGELDDICKEKDGIKGQTI